MSATNKYRKNLLFLLIGFVLLYLVLPVKSDTSMLLFYACFATFVYSTYIFFSAKNKTNYFDFDTLFVVLYGLCMYSTTFFYYNEVLYKALFMGYMFDQQYVNAGNLMSTIGILSYYCGSLKGGCKVCNKQIPFLLVNTRLLSSILVVLAVLFIIFGGVAYSKSAYQDGVGSFSSIISYVLLLLTYMGIVIVTSELYNKNNNTNYKIKKYVVAPIILVSLILLLGGSRSDVTYIMLPLIAIFTHYYYPVSKKKMALFFVCAIVAMWFIGQIRSGSSAQFISNPILFILDLTVTSRNTYSVFEYVDTYGFSFGSSMVGLFSCVPFLSNFLGLTNGSSELLTNFFFEQHPEYQIIGLGTTIIADIYLAFGLPGVVIIMYNMGKYVDKIYFNAKCNDYFFLIAYAALMSTAAFIVRGYCTIPLRPIIWCLVIAYINTRLFKHMKLN